ncbi:MULTISPECIES: haloacid dehalogenase type II [Burkholderiaceae]|uniref:Haloacid dehalogenase type II n=1 Tax=Paraburkholderia aromaticivorans TaxID=2026199 RepID=A0A248VXI4_9BURK|nr:MULTISPECIES: haloacid dehalogenase type II [Burkholderiaceae]ASW03741.1 haloacid dehalogenase type II [Paraburkholderia aromaticivorans]MBR8008600.1 haloacid dehalogenase type II [Burkholderia vietnamiensis]MBR8054659.1 haloacid dehalogenase type II [Burkholderia vietnamiensis]
MAFKDFKALSFDCYGTLVDWEAGMVSALQPLATKAGAEISSEELLQLHARHAIALEHATPWKLYRDLLATVYKRVAEQLSVPVTWDECQRYGRTVGDWPVFPDTANALRQLKKQYKLVVLSNVDNENFSRTEERLGVRFDAVITAEDIGTYKPDRKNFEYLIEQVRAWDIRPDELLHVACSIFHDVEPAKDCGLTTCFIDRRHGMQGSGATPGGKDNTRADFEFRSLAEFAEAIFRRA